MRRKLTLLLMGVFMGLMSAMACTSMVASGKATASGRPMLWKHRDTGAKQNYLEFIASGKTDEYDYIGLFNQGDTLHQEAWTGMNRVGFAIMNTASYNLQPDTAKVSDREGIVMALALRKCRTVADFAVLLDSLPKPMGVQANFGVIDADGNAAYFETSDHTYTPFYIGGDGQPPALIRTNFSVSGNDSTGMGYIRYYNAHHILDAAIEDGMITPEICIDTASRSFYHSLSGFDALSDTAMHWVVDQDFIPRTSSTASIVIVGQSNGCDVEMQVRIGYPPVADKYIVTFDKIPDDVRPLQPGDVSRAGMVSAQRKTHAFPIKRGSGQRYVDLDYLRTNQIN